MRQQDTRRDEDLPSLRQAADAPRRQIRFVYRADAGGKLQCHCFQTVFKRPIYRQGITGDAVGGVFRILHICADLPLRRACAVA